MRQTRTNVFQRTCSSLLVLERPLLDWLSCLLVPATVTSLLGISSNWCSVHPQTCITNGSSPIKNRNSLWLSRLKHTTLSLQQITHNITKAHDTRTRNSCEKLVHVSYRLAARYFSLEFLASNTACSISCKFLVWGFGASFSCVCHGLNNKIIWVVVTVVFKPAWDYNQIRFIFNIKTTASDEQQHNCVIKTQTVS